MIGIPPLVLSSIPNHPYDRHLLDQPFPLSLIWMCDAVHIKDLSGRVVYMRAGFEEEFYANSCLQSLEVEGRLRAGGSRIVNSVAGNGRCHRKDVLYSTMKAAGLPVPWFLPNPTPAEICAAVDDGQVAFPLFYRMADGCHNRNAMVLCRDMSDVKETHDLFQAGRFAPYYRTMAVEFIRPVTTGRFQRLRVYSVGGKVDMWAVGVADEWYIDGMCGTQPYPGLEAEFMAANEEFDLPEVVAREIEVLARVTERDLFAVDAVFDSAGRHFYVDVNPTYFFVPNSHFFPEKMRASREEHFGRVAKYLWSLQGTAVQ